MHASMRINRFRSCVWGRSPARRTPSAGLWKGSGVRTSVGVIGGAPKCAKTWLGLDMALSVATGTACLGKYAVPEPGPVLVYLAEDALAGRARTHRGNGPASRSRSRPESRST